MNPADDICTHDTRGDLLQRLKAAWADAGAAPVRPSLQDLAPCDHFLVGDMLAMPFGKTRVDADSMQLSKPIADKAAPLAGGH